MQHSKTLVSLSQWLEISFSVFCFLGGFVQEIKVSTQKSRNVISFLVAAAHKVVFEGVKTIFVKVKELCFPIFLSCC